MPLPILAIAGVAGKLFKGAFKGIRGKIKAKKASKAAAKALSLQDEGKAAVDAAFSKLGVNPINPPLDAVQQAAFTPGPTADIENAKKASEPWYKQIPVWAWPVAGFVLLSLGFLALRKR